MSNVRQTRTAARSVLPDQCPDGWRGAATWTPTPPAGHTPAGWQPWRVAPDLLRLVMSPVLEDRARIPNGVHLAVATDATTIAATLTGDPERDSVAEVLVDQEVFARLPVTEDTASHAVELPVGEHRVELWLPHSARTTVHQVDLIGATRIAPLPRPPFAWCAYGSSITQCNAADGPTTTWPALVARRLGWDLTALGMAGQCHLDLPLARACARSSPDLVTACLGINVYGSGTFNARSLPPAVTGFLTTLRELLGPRVPIVAISPIVSPDREDVVNPAGVTLAEVRRMVTAAVEAVQVDDDRLKLIDGPGVIGDRQAGLLGDGLHPSAAGYRHMADHLAPHLAAVAARFADQS